MQKEQISKQEYELLLEQKLNKALIKTEKSTIGFFIKNYRFTYLILAAIIFLGIFSLFSLPKEAEPEIKVPFAMVATIYPGANSIDTEELITDKIEKEIKNLDNLKIYTSESNAGFSNIFVEFEAKANLDESFRKLREAVDRAKPALPADAESPTVTEINFSDIPIVTYSLVGPYNNVELKKFADIIQNELEGINDVSQVDILGGLEQEFQVIVNEQKLSNFNISLNQINNAIRQSNFSLPAGNIEIDDFKYDVRVKGKFTKAKDLETIVVATFDNSPIFLSDLAEIKDTFKDRDTLSRIGFQGESSQNTISLQLRKKTGGNILNIVDDANDKLLELKNNGSLPKDLKIQKTNDNSVFIKKDIKTLGTSGVQTIILITLILLLILSFRGAIITALAVPFAFLNAFIFLKIQGLTLNSMVLFALVLSLGLMVDNAIIIIEGVNDYISKHKKNPYEAALLSIWNYKWAITAGTLTTVAAFAPMLLVSGILGQYISMLPKTITVTLLSSLFVALIIIPTLVSQFLKIDKKNQGQTRNKKRHLLIANLFSKLHIHYRRFMMNTLPYKKKRKRILLAVWIVLILALAIPISGFMKIKMFSEIDVDYFFVNIEIPIGSNLEASDKISRKIEKIISKIPEIDNYVVNIGASAASGLSGDTSRLATHLSGITINLVDAKKRKRKSYEIADSLREELTKISEAKITVEEISAGPPTGAPIEIRISGDSARKIADITDKITEFFKSTKGVINIKNDIENSSGEFVFTINKQKANYYGLEVSSIASTLRNAIYGAQAGTINVDGEDVDITIKYSQNEFRSINDLGEILLTTRNNGTIPISEVANIQLEPSLLSIKHRNGEKTAIVTADIDGNTDLKNVLKQFEDFQSKLSLPQKYSISVGGEVEDIQRSFQEVFLSMILSVLLISIILVLQFNSFKQPFLILFSLPLAFIGVIFGLNLLFMPFSFLAFIGIVSLSGIVVNDSIVLIDKINKNIKNGIEFNEAIIDGGIARMQPIFLTSITTIAGIFPLIYADEFWRGFSITVSFGLIFSTFLILIIIPLYYAGICKSNK